jgi:hypothetical protein
MGKSSRSLFGWLGRQLGYVKGGVNKNVTQPKIVYKKTTVHETTLPDRPDEKLRRTIIDEVVRKAEDPTSPSPQEPHKTN